MAGAWLKNILGACLFNAMRPSEAFSVRSVLVTTCVGVSGGGSTALGAGHCAPPSAFPLPKRRWIAPLLLCSSKSSLQTTPRFPPMRSPCPRWTMRRTAWS